MRAFAHKHWWRDQNCAAFAHEFKEGFRQAWIWEPNFDAGNLPVNLEVYLGGPLGAKMVQILYASHLEKSTVVCTCSVHVVLCVALKFYRRNTDWEQISGFNLICAYLIWKGTQFRLSESFPRYTQIKEAYLIWHFLRSDKWLIWSENKAGCEQPLIQGEITAGQRGCFARPTVILRTSII